MKQIYLGKIATAHGVKGLVKVLPSDFDTALLNGPVLTEDGRTLALTFKNPLGKYVLIAIDGVDDRDAAEALRGTKLYIPRESLPGHEDTFYPEDLIGLDVVQDGAVIGTVLAFENFGAGDLLDIALPSGQSFYLPFTDDYVLETAEIITVQNHEAMIFE